LSASSDKDASVVIATGDFTADEEVILPNTGCTLSHGLTEVTQCIYCDLGGFVNAEAIDIEHHDGKAGESFNLFSYRRYPLSEAILNAGSLGKRSFPSIEIAKSLEVTVLCEVSKCLSRMISRAYLIEVGVVTARQLICDIATDQETRFQPESRVGT
jgi:hypothetical protein